jgi:hypothetical protein
MSNVTLYTVHSDIACSDLCFLDNFIRQQLLFVKITFNVGRRLYIQFIYHFTTFWTQTDKKLINCYRLSLVINLGSMTDINDGGSTQSAQTL